MTELFEYYLKALVPFRIRRLLFKTMIVSNSYREEIELAESVLLMRNEGTALDSEYWAAMLRKYAHILDKGLQRCDCEAGHSNGFYSLAREAMNHIAGTDLVNEPSVLWARNKVLEYEAFQVSKCVDDKPIPFVPTNCTYEQLHDAMVTRRSVRIFTNHAVPRSEIEKIVSVVNWAPASCNRQTVRVYIADNPELVRICLGVNNGATCTSDNIPCFISFCADVRPYDMPHEMTLPVLDTALGIQNCCLAAHALGIGMTLLNWTHHTEEQAKLLRKTLGIPSCFRIVANAVLGYPAQGAPLPVRKSDNLTYTFA